MRPQSRAHVGGGISTALLLVSALITGTVLMVTSPADALPAFARKEGQDCSFCHSAYPKLNEVGSAYKQNGFRFPGEYGSKLWEDGSGIPLSVVAEIEVFLDNSNPSDGNNSKTSGPDGKIDEIEIMGSGTLSERVSFFTEIEFDSDGDAEVGPVWVQVNDLYGEQGQVNLLIGQYDSGLPFFSANRRVVRNKYLAGDRLGFFDTEFGAEINGQIYSNPDEEGAVIHRYGGGVMLGGSNDDDNKFTKGMGYYNVNWKEVNNVGVIAVGGQDETGGVSSDNFKTVGLGVVGQKEAGQWIFTGAYFFETQSFKANATNGGNQQFHNLMAEALFMPNESWVLGGRLDWLKETERDRNKDWGLRASGLARYNIISNLWFGGEYRFEEGGNGSPVNETETTHKARLFAFFAY